MQDQIKLTIVKPCIGQLNLQESTQLETVEEC